MATTEADATGEEPPEPRLFLIKLAGRKQPAYAICERTAIVELPADKSNRLGTSLYRRVDDFFEDQIKVARSAPSVAIPAELDPKGGGYVVAMSSMGSNSGPVDPDGDGDNDNNDNDNDNGGDDPR